MAKLNLIIVFVFMCLIFSLLNSTEKLDYSRTIELTKEVARIKAERATGWIDYQDRDTRNMDNYDVKYYSINLDLDFDNETIVGDNIITVEILENNVNSLVFDMHNNLVINSLNVSENTTSYVHENHQVTITFDQVLNIGDEAIINISYEGEPALNEGFGGGMYFTDHNGEPICFTLTEPYGSRAWFPCKDVPIDKAETVDISITAPSNYNVASNGLIVDETLNGDRKTTKWHESYPVSTYLISIAVTNYQIFTQTFTSVNNEIEINNYLLPEQYEEGVQLFSHTGDMIEFLQTKYGDYPFYNEKYGHAVVPGVGGAMEHQTCTTFGGNLVDFPDNEAVISVVLHELAHQWSGDMITCETWQHIWLNEGYATYSQALWEEHLSGEPGLIGYMTDLDSGTDIDDKLERDEDCPGDDVLDWVVYAKGAWTLHMLRGVLGDEVFFNVVRAYMDNEDLRYKTATTDDFLAIAEEVSGTELNWFFDEWYHNPGRPTYRYTLYRSEFAESAYLTLQSTGSQGYPFEMKIPYNYNGSEGTLFAEDGFNYLPIPDYGEVETLVFDPDNWILDYGYEEMVPQLITGDSRGSGVFLRWETFYDENIDGMNIYRKAGNGDFIQINTEPITGNGYFDDSTEMDITYTYKIAAVSSSDFISGFSNEVVFEPIDYSLNQGILLVDRTNDYPDSSPFPNDDLVDSYYDELLESYDYTTWDIAMNDYPSLSEMAKYSTIIWQNDDFTTSFLSESVYNLAAYVYSGGNLLISNWRGLSVPGIDELGIYLGIDSAVNSSQADFAGAVGNLGFGNMDVCSEHIPLANWGSNLAYVYKLTPNENSEVIFQFDSASDDPEWENSACAVRTTTGNKCYTLGFPLYFMEAEDAADFIEIVMEDFGEEVPISENIYSSNELQLSCYPNPFLSNSSATGKIRDGANTMSIYFNIPNGKNNHVKLDLYNILGQKVKSLENGYYDEGTHKVEWNGKNDNGSLIPSGIYFYKLEVDKDVKVQKISVIR